MLYNRLAHKLVPVFCGNGCRFASLRAMSSTPELAPVLADETPTKAVITLNRPRVLNAVTREMARMTHEYLKKFAKSKMLIIIKGAGDRSFTTGGDLGIVIANGIPQSKHFFREVYTLDYFLGNCETPCIAIIDGITMGGGVGLAVHGKYQVATERTVLAMPEAIIGLFPDVGSSYFLSRLSGKLGLYLGMTGHRLQGEDVMIAGMASHFCESSKLDKLESALLECNNPNDIPGILASFTTKSSKDLSPFFNRINKCFAGSSVEEIFQNLEKDGGEWAIDTLTILKKMSPLSLKITHRQMELGANLSLAECLKMEFRMVWRCLEHSNFKEGVRAQIIDKDKKPKWNPPTIEEVTDDDVAQFFANLPDKDELKL